MTCDKVNGTLDSLLSNNNNNNHHLTKRTMPQTNGKKSSKVPLILEEDIEKRKSLVILLIIFAAGILALIYIYKNFPEVEEWVFRLLLLCEFILIKIPMAFTQILFNESPLHYLIFKVGAATSENTIWYWRRETAGPSAWPLQRSVLLWSLHRYLSALLVVSITHLFGAVSRGNCVNEFNLCHRNVITLLSLNP